MRILVVLFFYTSICIVDDVIGVTRALCNAPDDDPPLGQLQAQHRSSPREAVSDTIIRAKLQTNVTFQQLTDGTGLNLMFITSALLGQHPLPKAAAEKIGEQLGLDKEDIKMLQTVPMRASRDTPSDPTLHRFYEMMQIYGPALKAILTEQFGDGIVSAVNFKLNFIKIEDPQGGHRAVITLDGKFLPYKPF